jgi:fructose-1,6-bisphosphatase
MATTNEHTISESDMDKGEYEAVVLPMILRHIASGIKSIHRHISALQREYQREGLPFDNRNPGSLLQQISEKAFVNQLKSTKKVNHIWLNDGKSRSITLVTDPDTSAFACTVVPLIMCEGEDAIGLYSIFSVHRDSRELPSGNSIIAAGLVCYGEKTQYICATKDGCQEWTYDPLRDDFEVSHENIACPLVGQTIYHDPLLHKYYPPTVQHFLYMMDPSEVLASTAFLQFLEVIKGGGFWAMPESKSAHVGMSLVYHCCPLAYMMEMAGGIATDFEQPILDLQPRSVDELSSFYGGSEGFLDYEGVYQSQEGPVSP